MGSGHDWSSRVAPVVAPPVVVVGLHGRWGSPSPTVLLVLLVRLVVLLLLLMLVLLPLERLLGRMPRRRPLLRD